jgi:multisubunit Na+/H+ antiporter MnhF subunit
MTLLCVSFLGLFALIYESDFLIDLTLDAAILTFIGSLAVAKYLAGKELDE